LLNYSECATDLALVATVSLVNSLDIMTSCMAHKPLNKSRMHKILWKNYRDSETRHLTERHKKNSSNVDLRIIIIIIIIIIMSVWLCVH